MSEKIDSKRPSEFFLLYQAPYTLHLKAAGVLLGILLIFRFKAFGALSTHFLGGTSRDSGLYVWLSSILGHDLFSYPWFQTKAFYPYGLSLAWSDNFIFPALFITGLTKIGFGLISSYNMTLLGAGFLNGYLTYRLCYGLWGSFIPAVMAGGAFESSAFFSGNLGHPQLQFAFWIPFALYYLFSYLSSPTILASIACGLTIAACFLTTIYYSVFIVVAVGIIIGGVYLLKPGNYSYKEILYFLLGAALGVAPILFFLTPYLEVRTAFGERGIYEAHYFSATALSYIAQSNFSMLYAWTSRFSHSEAFLGSGCIFLVLSLYGLSRIVDAKPLKKTCFYFILAMIGCCIFSLDDWHGTSLPAQLPNLMCALFSWIALILFIVLLYKLGKLEKQLGADILTNRDVLALCLLGALIFFLISLGPQGNPEKGHLALGVFRPVYELVPGFNSIRAIGRAGIVCIFFMSLAFSGSLTFLQKKGYPRYYFAIAGVVLLLENFPLTYPLEGMEETLNFPEAEIPKLRTSIVLPLTRELDRDGQVKSWGDYAELNIAAMLATQSFPGPIVNGYSGQRSKLMKELPRELADFPDLRSFNALSSICGLTHIIYRSGKNPSFPMQAFTKKIDTASELFQFVSGDSVGNYLFEKRGTLNLGDQKFELLVPPFPNQLVSLELMHTYAKKAPAAEVTLHMDDNLPGVPLAQFKLDADGEWRNFTVPLPDTGEKVRPLRISFRVEPEGAQVLFRSSTCTEQVQESGD